MEKEERIWRLASLKFSGEATQDELKELEKLLIENPELANKISQVELLWLSQKESSIPAIDESFNRHLQRLSNHFAMPAMQYDSNEESERVVVPVKKSFKKIALWTVSIAASIAGIIFLVRNINVNADKDQTLTANSITTKPGSKSKINLPDGTVVWLNADSKITYDENYGLSLREVQLTGEAYFEVVKDKHRPFIIHAKSMNIKVLGTIFNVRAYPDEKTSETSLIQGSVEVTLNGNPDKKIILKPSEKLVIKDTYAKLPERQKDIVIDETPLLTLTQMHTIKGDSNAIETAWIKNKLAFEGETLEDIVKIIQRWYDVKINITDDRLKAEKYTSVFENETLPEVLNALKMTGNFKYKIEKREVTIFSGN